MEELFKMPKLALNMEEGTVTRWLKEEGNLVAKGDPLVEVSTGKVNVQVEAPVEGKVTEILVPAGDKVPVGTNLVKIKPMPVTRGGGNVKPFDHTLAEEPYDLVVIGGGPGGYVAAIRAAQLGGRVALVEKDRLGGTCLNWGCIPTKTLIKSAELFSVFQRAEEFGLTLKEPRADLAKIMERKNSVMDQLRRGIQHLLDANGVKVISGTGAVSGVGEVKIFNEIDEIILKTRNIILATGSSPAEIPIPGVESAGVLSSNELLNLAEIPKSLVIIGGGVIGVEMAGIFNALGARVTIVEMLPRILLPVDDEIALQLQHILTNKGIPVHTGTKVNKITPVEGGGLTVSASGPDGQEKVFYGEKVLISIGRALNSKDLNLEQIGVVIEKGAIKVDSYMRTSIPGIYAIGDVTGKILLAHVASNQGLAAAENAMGLEREIDYNVVPSAIFTSPEVACIGLTESQARQQGYDIRVSRFPFAAIGKALTMGETEGQLKLICEGTTGKILGAHILGPHATDLIAVLGVSMKNGLTAEQIADTIFAHPTTAEIIMEAAHGINGKAIHFV